MFSPPCRTRPHLSKLIAMGLAVLSLVTASLAAIFVEKDVEEGDERQMERELMREIQHLREDVQRLRQEIMENKTAPPARITPDADEK